MDCKKYFGFFDEEHPEPYVIKSGTLPIIISAPHTYRHFREGRVKEAERGAGVVNGEGKMAASQIAQAKSLVPQTLFLAYGMNDMKVTDQESFLAAYRGILEDLKQSLPDTDIYVNCILPVRQQTAEAEPAYSNISQYNEGLKSLCEELKVTFIDNADLVKEEYYADDGIHMAPAYYTEWVNRMAEVAGL